MITKNLPKKVSLLLGLGLFMTFLKVKLAEAVCPICTIAVAAGVGLSRYLGIDDTISGLWIGAVTLSVSLWNINWFESKKIKFKFRDSITIIFYYALIVIPLLFTNILGNVHNALTPFGLPHSVEANSWGFLGGIAIDKLAVGIIIGTLTFFTIARWYEFLKANNNNRAYFPFQKVVMPVGTLLFLSIIYYLLTK